MLTINWNPPMDKLLIKHAEKMPLVVRDALTRLGVTGTSYAKRLTPVDSSNLRKRISYKLVGAAQCHIGTNVTYAPFILLDTKPFIIRAKNKKVLAWMTRGHIRPSTPTGWKEARKRGWARYAKEVRHPGGKDVIGKTERYLEKEIPQVVANVLDKHLKGVVW